jgi:FkbM family methyltransferase
MIEYISNLNISNCLDIGANTGQFARLIKNINKNIHVTSIEANPHCTSKIRRIADEYYIIGVSDAEGTFDFYLDPNKSKSKGASFYKQFNADNNSIKIDVTTLDKLLPSKVFDFIKIDVQGSEYNVIKGGEQTIKSSNYVLVETIIGDYNLDAPTSEKVIKLMETYNFFIETSFNLYQNDIMKKNNMIQFDLLFSKNINKHNLSDQNVNTYLEFLNG